MDDRAIKSLMNLKTSNEAIEFLKTHPEIDKWDAFVYFSQCKNIKWFEDFINSDLYPTTELYEMIAFNEEYLKNFDNLRINKLSKKLKHLEPWKHMVDAEKIAKVRNPFVNETDEQLAKLNYFFDDDRIYDAVVLSKPADFYMKNFSEEQILTSKPILHKHIGESLDNFFKSLSLSVYKEDAGRAKYFFEKKNAVLKCAMSVEQKPLTTIKRLIISKLFSAKDFINASSVEEVKKLPADIRSVLVNPTNVWKLHTTAQLIRYNIPKGKEWQVLEYFSAKDPKIFRSLAHSEFSRKSIENHYANIPPEQIPQGIKDYIAQSEKLYADQVERGKIQAELQRQQLEEQRKSWTDKNGLLIQFFELDDKLPISSKEDYFHIAQFFKQSGLSATAFCSKYKIDNIDGFRTMLAKIAEEDDEFGKFYNEFSGKQQKDFFKTCINSITGVVNGNLSVQDMIQTSSSSRNLSKLVSIASSTLNDQNLAINFTKEVISYYHARVNSYDETSTDPEEIAKMLTFKEIMFLLEEKSLEKLLNGKTLEYAQEIGKSIMPVRDEMNKLMHDKIYSSKSSLKMKLKPYSNSFSRYEYLSGKPCFTLEDGSEIEVNDALIDMAECFAQSHGLFRSNDSMRKIIKAVITGKIQNQEETENYKAELKEKIKVQLQTCKALEDYVLSSRQKI